MPPRCELQAEVQRTCEMGPWHAQWLRFRSEPDQWVTAVLVLPEDVVRPPVVIAHHGYGETKEGFLFGQHSDYPQAIFPPVADLTRSGMAVLGLDARRHGARLGEDAPDPKENYDAWHQYFETSWQWLARRCLIDGTCLQALLIHDVQCAIDYLQTRDDVNSTRIGMYGYSMGGTTCWSTTVVEPRIKVAAVGGCLITYDTALRVHRDASWHAWVPGIGKVTSREELISTIAPRPLLAIHGETDFPRDGVQPILDAATAAYGAKGCADHFRAVFLPGDHVTAAQDPELIRQVGQWFDSHL